MASFLRPVAHRGLHGAATGAVENTIKAFRAAADAGFAIECDVRPAADGALVVFHDSELRRLAGRSENVADLTAAELTQIRYADDTDETIATLADVVAAFGGRVPLMVELKTDWQPVADAVIGELNDVLGAHPTMIAVKSFDPHAMARLRSAAPGGLIGLVSGRFDVHGWAGDALDADRRMRLAHLLDSGPVAPDFISYHVADLESPVVRYVRQAQALPVFAWTVRGESDLQAARRHADAAIFETIDGARVAAVFGA